MTKRIIDPEKEACNAEIHMHNEIVTIIKTPVVKILKALFDVGILLRSIGNCPKTRTDDNIKAKTDASSGKRDASTTDADKAALTDKTEVRLCLLERQNCMLKRIRTVQMIPGIVLCLHNRSGGR